jgi:PPOX class probable F420-dependent enzyme
MPASAHDARAFLADHHRCVLATRRADGSPHLSLVVAAVTDDGRIAISTRAPSHKARNLRRDPAAGLLVMSDEFFGPWLQVDGTAEVVDLPEAMDGLEAVYRAVAGEHPDWDDFRRAMVAEERVVLLITVTS